MSETARIVRTALLGLAVVLVACDDGDALGSDPGNRDPGNSTTILPRDDAGREPASGADLDAARADAAPADATPVPPDAAPDAAPAPVLQQEGDVEVRIVAGQAATLTARLLLAGGVPVAGAELTARMLDAGGSDRTAEGVEGAFLLATRAFTDAGGRATFEVRGGPRPVTFRVEVSTPGTAPVVWPVSVVLAASGALRMRVLYDAADNGADEDADGRTDEGGLRWEALGAAVVRLYDSQDCAALEAAGAMRPAAWFQLAPIDPFDADHDEAAVADLDDRPLAVAVSALSADGDAELAWGCVSGVRAVAGEETRVDVVLEDR